MKTDRKNTSKTQPQQILTALFLTGIVSAGSGLTLLESATAAPTGLLPQTAVEMSKGNKQANRLPRPVANAVLRNLSRTARIPVRQLQIVEYSQQTWNNGCLELQRPDEACTEALVPGWRVVVSNGNQKWVYHTNRNGRNLRLNDANTPVSNLPNNFPKSVANGVLQAASQQLNVPTSQLKIVQAEQVTWSDGCLGLGRPEEGCLLAMVPGWRVVVESGKQRLVYHTNQSGTGVRLNEQASQIGDNNSRQKVSNAVLKMASQLTNLPTSQLKVIKFEEIIVDGCLNLPQPNEACTRIAQKAWAVTVEGRGQLLVFHSTADASQIRLNETASSIGNGGNVNLPQSIARKILAEASTQTRLPVSQLQIVEVKEEQWRDSCLGVYRPEILCAPTITAGWAVVVKAGEKSLVYHASKAGAIAFNEKASQIGGDGTIEAVPIPASELPLPLDQGVVFRQISSGGFAGRTYETVLRDDGVLIQVRIGDENDSERRVFRIPQQQVRQFQRLLERQAAQFNNISYPANGGADYITYTLTSSEGTVQYNDISQQNLPQNLQTVVEAWNEIIRRAQG